MLQIRNFRVILQVLLHIVGQSSLVSTDSNSDLDGIACNGGHLVQHSVLQATLLGRKKMAHKKILVSVFIIIISFGIIYLPQFITFYRLYGLVGITEPVGCMGIQSGMEMPIWLWLVFGYVIRLIIMLAYSGFFLFISNKIKSAFVTLTVMSIVIIIVFFVI